MELMTFKNLEMQLIQSLLHLLKILKTLTQQLEWKVVALVKMFWFSEDAIIILLWFSACQVFLWCWSKVCKNSFMCSFQFYRISAGESSRKRFIYWNPFAMFYNMEDTWYQKISCLLCREIMFTNSNRLHTDDMARHISHVMQITWSDLGIAWRQPIWRLSLIWSASGATLGSLNTFMLKDFEARFLINAVTWFTKYAEI